MYADTTCLTPGRHTLKLTDKWGYQGWRGGMINLTMVAYNETTNLMETRQLITTRLVSGEKVHYYSPGATNKINPQVVEREWTYTFSVLQPRSTIAFRGRATFTGTTGKVLEEGTAGPTLGTAEASPSKWWTLVDAGVEGATQLVYLKSAAGLYLEDWRGRVGLTTDSGREQKWTLTDASLVDTSFSGRVFLESSRGYLLEDRHGSLGLAADHGPYQAWTMAPEDTSSHTELLVGLVPGRRVQKRSLLFKPSQVNLQQPAMQQPAEMAEMAEAGSAASLSASPTYQLSNRGILTCQPGYVPVEGSKAECATAAAALGKTYSTTVYYDWERARPAGCFYHDSSDYLGDTVYFNPYQGGDRYGNDHRCFEIHDTADDLRLNHICTKLLPEALPTGAVLYQRYVRLELDGGASLAFFLKPA